MMDTKNVTIIFWDNNTNFHLEQTQLALGFYKGKSNMFNDVLNVNEPDRYQEIINKIDDNDFIIFLCHVSYGTEYNEYKKLKTVVNEIKLNTDRIYYVSSNVEAHVDFYNRTQDRITIHTYSTFVTSIKAGSIKPYLKKDLNEPLTKLSREGIFLSHSSKDKIIVDKFKQDILISALGISIENIFMTSENETGISPGEDIPVRIFTELKEKCLIFIQFLSSRYTESRVCVNEEGAAFVLFENKNNISIKLDDNVDLSFLNKTRKSIKFQENDIRSLADSIAAVIGKTVNSTQLNKKISEFLDSINEK